MFPQFGPWFDQIFPTPVKIYSWGSEKVYLYGVVFLQPIFQCQVGQKRFSGMRVIFVQLFLYDCSLQLSIFVFWPRGANVLAWPRYGHYICFFCRPKLPLFGDFAVFVIPGTGF